MIVYGNRIKRTLGKTITEFLKPPHWASVEEKTLRDARKGLESEFNEDGTAKAWTYYSGGGGMMRLYATEKMAQSRFPKGEVFSVEVPE